MANVNAVTLIGHVGDTPDFRKLDGDISVAVLSLATNAEWKTKDGERKSRTSWHRVVFYRGLADVVAEHVKKGAALYVTGSISYREYEADGEKRYITEIIADGFQFLDKKEAAPAAPAPKGKKDKGIDPEDIPFD